MLRFVCSMRSLSCGASIRLFGRRRTVRRAGQQAIGAGDIAGLAGPLRSKPRGQSAVPALGGGSAVCRGQQRRRQDTSQAELRRGQPAARGDARVRDGPDAARQRPAKKFLRQDIFASRSKVWFLCSPSSQHSGQYV